MSIPLLRQQPHGDWTVASFSLQVFDNIILRECCSEPSAMMTREYWLLLHPHSLVFSLSPSLPSRSHFSTSPPLSSLFLFLVLISQPTVLVFYFFICSSLFSHFLFSVLHFDFTDPPTDNCSLNFYSIQVITVLVFSPFSQHFHAHSILKKNLKKIIHVIFFFFKKFT